MPLQRKGKKKRVETQERSLKVGKLVDNKQTKKQTNVTASMSEGVSGRANE